MRRCVAPVDRFRARASRARAPGVTRDLLWREYREREPTGLAYTAFCNHYRRWLATQELVLRREHLPGDKLFVDYPGQTVPIR
ncbi:MAG: hypothetical protein IPG25_18955 [Proteobacteria bacterium]|nr:hypothetical protein [Pseudomonadota bacterium]